MIVDSHQHIMLLTSMQIKNVPVIFGHMGGSNWMDVIGFANEQENTYLDLSVAFTPLSVKTALTEEPEQCLFGSDAPFGEPKLCRQQKSTQALPGPALVEDLP